MMLFAASISRLFTTDPAVQAPAVDAIVAIHAAFLLIAPRMVVLVLLQAMGQARRAALVSLAPQGYLLIPLLVVLPPWFGLDGIVASLVVAATLTSVLAIALLIPILRDLRHGRMASLAPQAS
jgi:Na+-driven multidrug efflux pump